MSFLSGDVSMPFGSRMSKVPGAHLVWFAAAAAVIFAGVRWLQLAHREIVIGPFSPQGDVFVCYEFARHQTARLIRMTVRDSVTGAVRADLTPYRLQNQVAWAPDGSSLLGMVRGHRRSAPTRLMQVRWRPQVSEVQTWEVDHVRLAYFDAQGNPRVVCRLDKSRNRRRLEFLSLNEPSSGHTLPVGADERIYVYPTHSDQRVFVAVDPMPAGPEADYRWTDGRIRSLLQVDAETGEVLHQFPGDWNPLEYGASFVWRHDVAQQRVEVAEVGAIESPIMTWPHRWIPFAETPQGVLFRGPANEVRFQGPSTGETHTVRLPAWGWLSWNPQMFEQVQLATPQTIAVAYRGRVVLVDVPTSESTVILDSRRGVYLWQGLAWGGLLLVAQSWFWLPRLRYVPVYAEVALWGFSVAAIVVVWTSVGLGPLMPRSWPVVTALGALSGSLLYYFVWLFLDRDHWLRRLSILCVLTAAALNVMLLWTRGSDSRWIVDSMLAGAVALAVLFLGALVFPHVSEVCRRVRATSQAARQRHVTLWQVLAFLATVGLFLSQLQFVPLGHFAMLAEPARLLWVVGLAVWMACLAWSAAWSAWAWSRTWTSLAVSLLLWAVISGAHYAFAQGFRLIVQWDEPRRYAFSLLVVLWVWLSMRIAAWRQREAGVNPHPMISD